MAAVAERRSVGRRVSLRARIATGAVGVVAFRAVVASRDWHGQGITSLPSVERVKLAAQVSTGPLAWAWYLPEGWNEPFPWICTLGTLPLAVYGCTPRPGALPALIFGLLLWCLNGWYWSIGMWT